MVSFGSPEFGVDLLGELKSGHGYMIYMNETFENFTFSDN